MDKRDDTFFRSLLDNHPDVQQTYTLYRDDFVRYAFSVWNVEAEVAMEIFQECFLIFYENLVKGKYVKTQTSLKTYLFGIGNNLLKKHRKQSAMTGLHENDLAEEWLQHYYEDKEWSKAKEVVHELIYESTGLCNKVLQWFYYEKKSMKEIAALMDYKSEQVAKNRKKLCVDNLIAEVKSRLKKLDIYLRVYEKI